MTRKMLYFTLKILFAIAVALFLLYLARRWLKNNGEKERFVRTLPGAVVQEIADRLEEKASVEQYLERFFLVPYCGEKIMLRSRAEFDAQFSGLQVPAEEKEDLLRVLSAIDENDLLAYALAPENGKAPCILALCRTVEEENALDLYLFRPEIENS